MNAIVGCCLSGKANIFHSHQDASKLGYYWKWAESILRAGLFGVVLHDGLDTKERATNIMFVEVGNIFTQWTVYDDCWIHFADWLRHEDIEKVIFTDVADVVINYDPFPLITDDRLYLCREERTIAETTFTKKQMMLHYGEVLYGDRVAYNAGIIGGRRDTVLRFADDVVDEIHKIAGEPDGEHIAEQAAMNTVIHRDGWDVVSGAPFHSELGGHKPGKAAISHK